MQKKSFMILLPYILVTSYYLGANTLGVSYFSETVKECSLDIPENKIWNGKTQKNSGGKLGNSSNINLIKKGDLVYEVSDFSAGWLGLFGTGDDHEAEVEFDCTGRVIPSEFSTLWGKVKIIEGNWKEGKLTLHRSLEFNEVNEISIFEVKY